MISTGTKVMYSVSVKHEFEARHFTIMADGSPEPPHWHHWQVEVEVMSDKLDNHGFVMDFIELEKIVKTAASPLVGCTIVNNLAIFKDTPPTAERVAEYFMNQVLYSLPDSVKLGKVVVEEAKNCKATITL